MDYFSQLLESYGKIKKRTYKLTFLSEEAMDIGKAKGIIKTAMGGATPHDTATTAPPVKYEDGSPSRVKTFYKQTAQGKVIYLSFTPVGQKQATLMKANVAGEDVPAAIERAAAVLVEKPEGGKKEGESTDKMRMSAELAEKQIKAELEARNRTIDGSLAEHAEQWLGSGPRLNRAFEKLQNFIKDGLIQKLPGQLDYLVFAYGNGSYGGFIRQMLGGKATKFEGEGEKAKAKQITKEFSPAEFDIFAKNFSDVITCHDKSKGSEEGKEFCNDVTKKVGIYKGKPVIFGADESEAVVLPSTDWSLAAAFKKITAMCFDGDEDSFQESLRKGPKREVAKSGLNSARGVIFENITVLGINLVGAKTDEDRLEAKKKFDSSLSKIKKDLRDKVLEEFGLGEDAAQELIAFDDNEQTKFFLDLFKDKGAMTEYVAGDLSRVAGLFKKLVKGRTTAEVTGGGKAAGGERDDVQINYESEEEATSAGQELDAKTGLGAIVPALKNGIYKLMLGCKRYVDRFSAKTGEVNSRQQNLSNMDPRSKGNSNFNAEGMRPRILKELFGWDGRDNSFDAAMDQWEDTYNYYKKIEDKNDKIVDAVTQDNIFVSQGKIKVESPKKVAQQMLDKLTTSIGFGKFNEATLKDYLYEKDGDSVVLKDFSDTPLGIDNRNRLAEVLTRLNRTSTLAKDLKSKDEKKRNSAKKAACLMMYSTGGNVDDLGQLLATDNKGALLISQTGLIRSIAGTDPEDLEVSIAGTFGIELNAGNDKVFRINQERTSGKKDKENPEKERKVDTRFAGEIPSQTFEKHGMALGSSRKKKPSREDSSIEILLKGQLRLLEDLLNQTNDSPLL